MAFLLDGVVLTVRRIRLTACTGRSSLEPRRWAIEGRRIRNCRDRTQRHRPSVDEIEAVPHCFCGLASCGVLRASVKWNAFDSSSETWRFPLCSAEHFPSRVVFCGDQHTADRSHPPSDRSLGRGSQKLAGVQALAAAAQILRQKRRLKAGLQRRAKRALAFANALKYRIVDSVYHQCFSNR